VNRFAALLVATVTGLLLVGGASATATTEPTAPPAPTVTHSSSKFGPVTVTVDFHQDATTDLTTMMCSVDDGKQFPYTTPFKVETVGKHTVTCRVKNTDGVASPVGTTSFEVCEKPRPHPPTADVKVKFHVGDCTSTKSAYAWLEVWVRDKHQRWFRYSTSDGQHGALKAGGNAFRYDHDRKLLKFAEDAGTDGVVEVTFGKTTKKVKTNCAETTTTTTTPTSTTTTTTVVPPVETETTDNALPVVPTTTTPPVQVADVAGRSDGGLAYTGTSDALPTFVGIGIVVVALGGGLVLLGRSRSRRSGNHRP
jgi:hypothetical protein